MTNEERNLIDRLNAGELDGIVGDLLGTSGGSTVWTTIKNGMPVRFIGKHRTIKKPSSQPQILFNSPKPPLPRTCHIRKACTSQVLHPKRESVLEQNGCGDTER